MQRPANEVTGKGAREERGRGMGILLGWSRAGRGLNSLSGCIAIKHFVLYTEIVNLQCSAPIAQLYVQSHGRKLFAIVEAFPPRERQLLALNLAAPTLAGLAQGDLSR